VPRDACAAAEHRKRANRRRRRSAVQLCPHSRALHSRQGRVCAVRNDRCCEGGRGCGQ
jgi:hypothetical protein